MIADVALYRGLQLCFKVGGRAFDSKQAQNLDVQSVICPRLCCREKAGDNSGSRCDCIAKVRLDALTL